VKRLLFALAFLLLGATAHAQLVIPLTPVVPSSGGGCSHNCTFTGITTTAGIDDTVGINTPSIGALSPGTGVFTTLQSNGELKLGDGAFLNSGTVPGLLYFAGLTGPALTGAQADANLIFCTSDALTSSGGASCFNILHNYGGGTLTGGRNTFQIKSTLTAQSGQTNGNYTGLQVYTSADANDNGTSGTPSGAFWGENIIVKGYTPASGSSYYNAVTGNEYDIGCQTNVTCQQKFGVYVLDTFDDANAATIGAVAFDVAAQTPSNAPGWDCAFCLGYSAGDWPFLSGAGIAYGAFQNKAGVSPNGLVPNRGLTTTFDATTMRPTKWQFAGSGFDVSPTGTVYVGTGAIAPTSTGMSIDVTTQSQVSAVAVATGGANYTTSDYVYGPNGGVYHVTGLGAGNAVTSLSIISPDVYPVGSTPSNPVTLRYGMGNQNLTVNFTWTAGTILAIANPTITAGTMTGTDASAANVTATASTTARTLAVRAANVINVKDFGAVCDGTTDDSSHIAAALTQVAAGNVTTVYFPPSATACMSSAALTVPSGTTLWAYPGTATLQMAAGSTANPGLLSIANVSNVLVYGLILDGNLAGVPAGNNVNTVFQSSNVVFDHVTVQNTRGIGAVFSTQIVNSGIRDSSFTNVGNYWITSGSNADQQQGVVFCCGTLANNHDNFVTGSQFTSTGLDAISIASQANFVASANRFKSVGGRYTNGGAAIYAANNSSAVIGQNSVNGAYGNGIDVIATPLATIVHNDVQFAGGAGISYAQGSWSSIVGNVSCNNNQGAGASALQAGISLNGNTTAVTETTVAGNTVCDTQGSPTQTWGIQEVTSGTYTNVWIDQSNTPDGNVSGPFGQALSAYTPLKVGTTVGGIAQTGTTPNQGVALLPTGTGAIMGAVPNAAPSGGNARGSGAIDLQLSRTAATQVASGLDAVLIGGANSTGIGANSVTLCAQWCLNTGANGLAFGSFANTEFRNSGFSFASGQFAGQGDSQLAIQPLRATTTGTGAVQLTSTGGGDPNNTNIMNVGIANISINHAVGGTFVVTARSAAPDVKVWTCTWGINGGATASTVTLVSGSACTSSVATTGASTWALTIAADNTNGGVNLAGAGAAATTVHWTAVPYATETGN
jgi:hypothetical protein